MDNLYDKYKKYNEYNEYNECSICLDKLENNISILPCNHTFHCDCITMWILTCKKKGNKFRCPYCKQKFETCSILNKTNENEFKIKIIKPEKMKLTKNSKYYNENIKKKQ